MLTENQFEDLLKRNESETLDFKEELYDFQEGGKRVRNEFIKDVICMANTPREETAHIVFGVRWTPERGCEAIGLSEQVEDILFMHKLGQGLITTNPKIWYHPLVYAGKQFGVLGIPVDTNGPFVPTKSLNGLNEHQVYIRRNSMNAPANPEELKDVARWFEKSCEFGSVNFESETWSRFLDAVCNFEHERKYILIADPVQVPEGTDLSGIGYVPWSAVIDFDPDSEQSGLLSATRSTIEINRSVQLVVKKDSPRVNTRNGTLWFFARGLRGRESTVNENAHREWMREYGIEMGEQVRRVATAISPSPVTIVLFWNSTSLRNHLGSTLGEITKYFGDSEEMVLVTQDPSALGEIPADYDIPIHVTSYRALSAGLKHFFESKVSTAGGPFAVPCKTGEPYALDSKDRMWMEEDLEIVHLAIGLNEGDVDNDFYRGGEISWRDLHLHRDCERDITEKIQRRVEDDLVKRRTIRISLCNQPGAGGTTIARRIIWNLHQRFPCAVLHQSEPSVTADRLSKLSALTENSVLLLVDGSELSERTIEDVDEYTNGRQTPVVILQVLRRFSQPKAGERRFWVQSELSSTEADRFYEAYSEKAMHKRTDLARLLETENPKLKSAFYFGLQAFGKEFRGLEQYVAQRIDTLKSETQRTLLGYIAMAHNYAQHALPIQSFAEKIGISRRKKVELGAVFPESVFDLLVVTEQERCRTSHAIIAEEILVQLLGSGAARPRRVWKQQLSEWAIRFTWFLRAKWPVPSEELLELARRTFVYRNNNDLLGTESSAQKKYSHLVEEISTHYGRGELFKNLVEAFPDQAHFHAHLARYLGQNGRYGDALREIEKAIRIQENDSVLHHMKGMIYRYQIRDLMSSGAELNVLLDLADNASAAFEKSRNLSEDNEHGYISDVQMWLYILDYAAKVYQCQPSAVAYHPDADPYLRESLDYVESLLDLVQDYRGEDKPSFIEIQCRTRLDLFYEDHSEAVRAWISLLSRSDIAHAPVRRQIVWTMLHRDKQWAQMKPREIDQCIRLLEKNMEEDIEDEKSMLLWLRAVRYATNLYSLDRLLEKVSHWRINLNSIESVFYYYVLNTLKVIDGSGLARLETEKALEECRNLARFRRSSRRSIEWLSKGSGIRNLVHQSQLGEWKGGFWDAQATKQLARVEGRISTIGAPQKGEIEFGNGQFAFFVPAKGDFHAGRDENRRVSMFVGFSYEGPRAWVVEAV